MTFPAYLFTDPTSHAHHHADAHASSSSSSSSRVPLLAPGSVVSPARAPSVTTPSSCARTPSSSTSLWSTDHVARRPAALCPVGARHRSRRLVELAIVPGDPQKPSLVYSVYSYTSLYADTGLRGDLVRLAARRSGRGDGALHRSSCERLADSLTDEEVERTKEQIKGQIVLSMETPSARMNRLGRSVLMGLEIPHARRHARPDRRRRPRGRGRPR